VERRIEHQGLSSCKEQLTKDLAEASKALGAMRDQTQTLSDERSRLLGQLDCLQTQLAARDQSLVDFVQTQTKLEEIQNQLVGTMSAFEVQGTAMGHQEREFQV